MGEESITLEHRIDLKIKNKSKTYIDDKIKYALKLVNLEGFEKRMPNGAGLVVRFQVMGCFCRKVKGFAFSYFGGFFPQD